MSLSEEQKSATSTPLVGERGETSAAGSDLEEERTAKQMKLEEEDSDNYSNVSSSNSSSTPSTVAKRGLRGKRAKRKSLSFKCTNFLKVRRDATLFCG